MLSLVIRLSLESAFILHSPKRITEQNTGEPRPGTDCEHSQGARDNRDAAARGDRVDPACPRAALVSPTATESGESGFGDRIKGVNLQYGGIVRPEGAGARGHHKFGECVLRFEYRAPPSLLQYSTGVLTDIPEEQIIISQLPELPDGTVTEGVDVTIRLRDKSS